MLATDREGANKMITITDAITMRIQKILDARGITITDLSRRAGLTQSTVNEVMKGKSKFPRIITILKITDALHMTLGEFFSDKVFDDVVEHELDAIMRADNRHH